MEYLKLKKGGVRDGNGTKTETLVIEKVIGFAVIEKVIINTESVNKNQDES